MSMITIPTTQDLIRELGLLKHPEGGYFASERGNAPRSLATSIYYLLTYDNPNGVFHMNKSVTYHVLHRGRAEYTLIHPPEGGEPPRVETKIIGTNAGETRLLLVGTGVWKMSRLLPEDVENAKTEEQKARLGCLITEVVVPGFHWEDHQFLAMDALKNLFKNNDEKVKQLAPFIRQTQ
ncbi:RmlC-like cupin domain-containing protein [Mucidula mucida]|nr:RmlC-like cupin domain-containing protein [Mucidula mucida]